MAETQFEVEYDGPALAGGRMDVRDLAPALLALGELFQEANGIVNADVPQVSLEVKATEVGSFDIALVLVLLHNASSLLNADPVAAAANLKELVVGREGLFGVVKRLRGRRIGRRIPQDDGTVLYETTDGEKFSVPRRTDQAYQRINIQRRTREVLEPLEREGIDVVRFREVDTNFSLEIGTPELPPVVASSTRGEAPFQSLDTRLALEITSPNFRQGRKWRLSDGERSITAAIDDEPFLQRVDRGDEVFRKGDILRCDVHIDQFQTDKGLRSDYTVTHVHEHIPQLAADPFPQMAPRPDPKALPPGD